MADKNIEIGIRTTGAENAARKIDDVADSAEKLANSAGREAARSMENMAEKARVAEFAYYDLDAEIGKTSKSTETFTAGQTQVQSSTRNSAQALYIFSQAFEDASYGIRGVLNNIPQLVIALGGTAGLAGAISIGAVALSQILPLFQQTEEKASDLKDNINELAGKMGEMEELRFNDVGDEIDSLTTKTDSLKQKWEKTKTAENEFATSLLENSGNLAEALRTVEELLGKQADKYKEIKENSALDEEKRKLAAQQEIEAENQKRTVAEEAATKAADYLQVQRQRADVEKANLVDLRAQLEVLREQQAALEKIASGRGNLNNLPPSLQEFSSDALKSSRNFSDYSAAVRAEAGRQANDPTLEKELAVTQDRVSKLEAAIERLTGNGGIIDNAENALNKAQTELADINSAVETKIEEIKQGFEKYDLKAKAATLKEISEQQAKDLSAAVEKITTSTEAGKAAKETILSAAEDGKITADESQRVAQSTAQLLAQTQAGLATAGGNSQQVIAIMKAFVDQEAKNSRELQNIWRAIQNIQARQR